MHPYRASQATFSPTPPPARCPTCGNRTKASQRTCKACNRQFGARAASFLARAQLDPTFTSVLLAQLAPSARAAFTDTLMKTWAARQRLRAA